VQVRTCTRFAAAAPTLDAFLYSWGRWLTRLDRKKRKTSWLSLSAEGSDRRELEEESLLEVLDAERDLARVENWNRPATGTDAGAVCRFRSPMIVIALSDGLPPFDPDHDPQC